MIIITMELIGPSKTYDAIVIAKVVLKDMSIYATVKDSVNAVKTIKNKMQLKLFILNSICSKKIEHVKEIKVTA